MLPDLALGLVAAGFALMGAGALAAPDQVTRQFDIPPLSVAGRNEVRAVYGGFGLAMATILVAALTTPSLRTGVCLTLAAALGGMAVGRLVSFAFDRKLDSMPLLYLVIETAAAALLLYAA